MSDYSLYERDEPNISPFEQSLYDEISADEPWDLIERFSEIERISGTNDEKRGAEYITDRLQALGVSHDQYDPELYISQPNDAEISIAAPERHTFETAKTVAFSNDETVRGEALYVESTEDDELAGAFDVGLSLEDVDENIEGKIVVVKSILPIKAISELAEAGAAGFVGIHPHDREPHEGIASPVWGGVPDPQDTESIPDIVVVNVSQTEGDELLAQLDEHGTVELEVSADVTTDWFECPVIVARISGEANPTNDFILLHGHYDSWYVGITDNATGDAGLLELARVFNDNRDCLRRDLWVAWWPGHSTGRYAGSTWFVDEFAHDLHDKCVAHVNMDSPGVKDATEFYFRPKWMSETHDLCRTAIDDVAGKNTEENRPPRAGDYSFNNLGIPGMSIQSSIPEEIREERGYHPVGGSGGHANAWHLTTDTIEKADPKVLVRDVRVFATAVARLLNEDVIPLDYRHTMRRHQQTIEEYEEVAGDRFDLGPIREEVDVLVDLIDDFYDGVKSGDVDPDTANRTIAELSRSLVRINYTSEGPFEQDPAVYRPPYTTLAPILELPSMEGNEYRFQQIHLKRARNDAVQRLRDLQTSLSGVE